MYDDDIHEMSLLEEDPDGLEIDDPEEENDDMDGEPGY